MRIYLHIGYPKAASSWFQKKFLPNVKNIKVYERKFIRECFLDPGAFEFSPGEFKSAFESKEDIDIWLSEELLLGRLRPGGVKGFVVVEIAKRLKEVFPDAKIIIFIRNQIDILASAYMEYVRSGGNFGINKFLFPERYFRSEGNRLVLLGLDYFLYDRIINLYNKLFGNENVNVFLYEDFAENPKSFIAAFSNFFNLTYEEDSIDYSPENSGYRRFLIQTRRFISIFTRSGPLNKYYIIHLPKVHFYSLQIHRFANRYSIFGRKPNSAEIIGKKNIEFLKKYYLNSNRKLRDIYHIKNLEKYNYPL